MLDRNRFVVKEQIKILSSTQTYAIMDGESGEQTGTAQEVIGLLVKALRWVMSKQLLPTRVEVREKPDDSLVFTIRRGVYLFRSRVEVLDAQGALIGYFRSKILTISGGFHVYDKDDKHFAEVKGKMFGFDYRFRTPDGKMELGRVSKKWGGVMKELFTSADSYGVEINPELAEQPMAKMLILAAVLAIDLIYKSESRTVDVPGLGD
ncbi:MAG: hypothetical protein JWO38_2501 [Gemmataceae bacterium]|nr:hypothetical protein [Gemmataceae bacterium]